jgi:hypothetical protein
VAGAAVTAGLPHEDVQWLRSAWVLPSVLQPLAGGQSILTTPADGAVTVGSVLEFRDRELPGLARRLRDETGALAVT